MTLSKTDIKLLHTIQRNASLGLTGLAEVVGMSKTSCWRKIKDFEEGGIIQNRVDLLDPAKLGLKIYVLLSVSMVEHSNESADEFEHYVEDLPNVMECFSVSGDKDYILHVITRDMEAYSDFLNQKILHHPLVRSASSSFALRRIKYTTELPIG